MTDLLSQCYEFVTQHLRNQSQKLQKIIVFLQRIPLMMRQTSGDMLMDKDSGSNVAEKQRLRDAIADQVRRFIDSGGNITVVETPSPADVQYRGSTWDTNVDSPSLLTD